MVAENLCLFPKNYWLIYTHTQGRGGGNAVGGAGIGLFRLIGTSGRPRRSARGPSANGLNFV